MQQFCRTCLQKIPDANFVVLNNEDAKVRTVRAELSACLPELQQDLVKDPVICAYCVSVLHLTYIFKTQCFDVENRIRRLMQNQNINVADFTLTELFNSSEINNAMISGNCNVAEVLTVKEEYVSEEKERTNACSFSLLYKVPNVVTKSDVTMEQIQEQNDLQNLTTTNIQVIAGLSARYEELMGAASVSSGVSVYNISKHEISQEMNNTSEEIIIKEEHELEIFKTEEALNETVNVDVPMKEYEEQEVESSFNVGELTNSSSVKFLQNTTKQLENARSGSASNYEQENSHKKSFCCNVCKYSTTTKGNLVAHIRLHTGEKSYHCANCEYVAARKDYLVSHMRIHTGEKPFHCNFCKFNTAHKKNLTVHLRIHSDEEPFRCNKCDFKASLNGSLVAHMSIHSDQKPFRCKICDFSATQKINLNNHMTTHTGEKPFSCNICALKLTQKGHLASHMRTHTGEKPFHCNICDLKVSQKGQLTRHMRTHSGEKPFRCNYCDFNAKWRGSLIAHMRVHTGEKPFQCSNCDFKTRWSGNLASHMRIHTGDKPFRCNVCDLNLTRKEHLVRHQRTHIDEKP